jgi:hypothetical protein
MFTKELFDSMARHPPAEITRAPLTRLVLAAKEARLLGGTMIDEQGRDYMSPKEIFAEAIQPPNEEDIDLAILVLKVRRASFSVQLYASFLLHRTRFFIVTFAFVTTHFLHLCFGSTVDSVKVFATAH